MTDTRLERPRSTHDGPAAGPYADEVRTAFLIRKAEHRLLELFAEGKLFGTVHTAVGQEFVGVAVARALEAADYVFSNHRCHGHFLAYCGNLVGLIAEIMGKSTGACAGRGGSQHLHYQRFSSNGIQGGIVPISLGLAMAQELEDSTRRPESPHQAPASPLPSAASLSAIRSRSTLRRILPTGLMG
ncbi:MAG: thiamine pyrophosphate-dependent enzyme [Alphaproteobacteria bacterium]|nr:thiamine pyrophosphate-dependent enzyme [Alphaproteobacteria bacterium]MDP6271837.1 thiamine pyrophosphate-dependent enzyme [Alphaproteobacteria bacterium]MDP7429755.1 thiamine pyrophosphate-dependent enzyme [Alphaproteobacteria bacterium]